MHVGQAGQDAIGLEAGLAAALDPIARLAVEVFGPCVAAVVDVIDLGDGDHDTEGFAITARAPVLTVATDDRLVDLHATAFALDEGPAPEARRRGEVVVDELPSRLGSRWDLLADDAGLASALSRPLIAEGGPGGPSVVGVLTLYGTQRPGVRTLDRLAVALLASVAATMIAQTADPERAREAVPLDQLVLDLGLGAIPTIDLRGPTTTERADA
jgi:hypothetical protein